MGLDFDELIYVLVFLVPLALRFLSGIVKAVARTFGIELSQTSEAPAAGKRAARKSPRPLPEKRWDDALDPTPAEYLIERVEVEEPKISVPRSSDRDFRPEGLIGSSGTLKRPRLGHLAEALQADEESGVPRFDGGLVVGVSEPLAGSGLETQLQSRSRSFRRPTVGFVPGTIDGWRRGIILQEILAPPVALRREYRPGELLPFEIV
jgi:hypothetical protein